nr:hypothetical protein [uncultured Actinoplanes sp.]
MDHDRLTQAVVDFVEHHDDRLLLADATRAEAEALPLGDGAAACLLAMYMTCRQEAMRDRDPSTLPDLDWPMQVLAASMSGEVPPHLRELALTVARLVSPEAGLRSALRALAAALSADDAEALDAALGRARHAVRTPDLLPHLEHQAWYLIAAGWWRKYLARRHPADLDDAVAASARDVEIAEGPDRAEAAVTHATLLAERVRLAGTERDIADLAGLSREADVPELAGPLRDARLAMFRRTGDADHLDELVRLGGADLIADTSLTGDDLSMLCLRLRERYQRGGDVADLDAAVSCGRRSVQLPYTGPVELARRLANLFDALGLRAADGQQREYLDEAVEVADVAVELLARATEPAGGPAGALSGLRGEFLVRRWQITHVRGDLDAGIDQLIAAGDAAQAGNAPAARHRQAAAEALMRRFRRRRHAGDLDAADQQLRLAGTAADPVLRQAVVTARNHPPRLFVQPGDGEGMPSPHALANLHAWNSGEPRTSGLTWVHT